MAGRRKAGQAKSQPARAAAQRFELAMRAINEGVYDWDVANGRMHYSQGVYSVLKMPRNMKTAADWRKRIHPDDLAAYDAAIVAHFKKKTRRFECDYRFRATDGTWHWARQRGIALRDQRGRAVRMIGSIGDISELKQAEEARRLSDERYELAMRGINEGVYDWDIANDKAYYSERVYSAVGMSPKDYRTARGWHKRIHPEDRPKFDAALVAHFKGKTERFECDYRYRARDGSWHWARQHGIAVRDAKGRAIRLIGSTGNIDDLKRAELELRRAHAETAEALERQTATAEILKVISSSPTDLRPTFKAILESTTRLCESNIAALFLYDGQVLSCAAHHNTTPEFARVLDAMRSPPSRETATRLAALERAPVRVDDYQNDPRFKLLPSHLREESRSLIAVPLLREDALVGVITTWRREVRPFADKHVALLQTFADQAVIAIENVRLFNETKEALEQQKASGEVLSAISSSIADTAPVFDKILESCQRLFAGTIVGLNLVREDDKLHIGAYQGAHREEFERIFPIPLTGDSGSGLAIVERRVVHYPDAEHGADVPARTQQGCKSIGIKSVIFAPLLWEGRGLGAIFVGRDYLRAFSEKEIALLRTFADQAVIAIENVRLFNETKESLEKQTATADILQVLSGSPSNTQPVFDAIVRHAARLCESTYANVFRYDGQQIHLAASHGGSQEALAALRSSYPAPPSRKRVVGRVIETGQAVHVEDTFADAEYDQAFAGTLRLRRLLGVPLQRSGGAVGAITVGWAEPGPILHRHEDLLKTFADQGVIAIENVRLFNETKEALERQTATAEILRVISSSPADVGPVFEAILENAVWLCDSPRAAIFRFDGEQVHLIATRNWPAEALTVVAGTYPRPPDARSINGRAILSGHVAHIEDALTDESYDRKSAVAGGWRRMLGIPLLREGKSVGALALTWPSPGRTPEHHVKLLKSFADQAVIAIENVRLFKELQSRTEALTKSVSQLTALGEVGQAISSTLELDKVLQTIVERAVKLTGLDGGSIYEYDEATEQFSLQASENIEPELVEAVRKTPVRRGEGAIGTCAVTREPAQVPDILDDSYHSGRKEILVRAGYRAILAVPLLREDHLLGALQVFRRTPGRFAPEVVELLKTFATQSAMAIQNARLFREIAEKGRQLEVASQHKSQFLASMSHELRTPLNAILGFNEMILGQVYGEVPKDMQEPLADIQSSGKHLLRLINNVLDLAKIEAGRMELSLQDYSVQDTVGSVHSTLRPLAADKGLEFLATVPADIPLAFGDPGRITQCLMNLAGNSLKFTKSGKVEISVALNDGGLLRYSVTDTGMGIAPDKIGSLFTEFKQTDATIANEYGGTGLGLSISKKFIEMHGGRIWVESEPGKGSAFIFEVPLQAKAT